MAFEFYRLSSAAPPVRVGDAAFNADRIADLYQEALNEHAAAVVFPELAVSGYSCGDLFFQNRLHREVERELRKLAELSRSTVMIVGLPWREGAALYNAAAVLQDGAVLGVALKSVLPNYREFYEKRQFRSGLEAAFTECRIGESTVPVGVDLLFDDGGGFRFGVEICEDLWSVIPPSCHLALAGAEFIFNPSASTELVGKAEYRRGLAAQQSGRCLAAYALAGAGVGESTADVVYGGHSLIAVNGRIAAESRRFERSGSLIFADVDAGALRAARMSESSFNDCARSLRFRRVACGSVPQVEQLKYLELSPHPFVPDDSSDRERNCREIFDIQCAGLARRIEHTGSKTVVLGLSGGLDSTLALLVAVESFKLLGRPLSGIVAVTMPGFGTSSRTRNNCGRLCAGLGVDLREIDITAACRRHFSDIGHDENVHDVTYENTQARERTQILMDVANQERGIVIGTGDLSEVALGWSTFNGDHMAMYGVNSSVPKTLVRYVITHYAEKVSGELREALLDVVATPVSPELLPPDENGRIRQKTEELIGKYELHDFFLYHFLKSGAEPEKLLFMARHAFAGRCGASEIRAALEVFLRRFWSAQFKRNSLPDGPKVGSISLSPRGDWRMPSDATAFEL